QAPQENQGPAENDRATTGFRVQIRFHGKVLWIVPTVFGGSARGGLHLPDKQSPADGLVRTGRHSGGRSRWGGPGARPAGSTTNCRRLCAAHRTPDRRAREGKAPPAAANR